MASSSQRKVIVAGPGTGKTYLFKQVLRTGGKALTLSFINALVDDLSLELCGLSDVRTLHGFARSELNRRSKRDVKIFPRLPEVIAEDAGVLLGTDPDFDAIFQERQDDNALLPFYRERKDYYGSYYGLADIVFALVQYYEKRPEHVPVFDQVIVDEFQDFNRLEVSLIDILASRSPILLAGDDDQALYEFKKASTKFIRERYGSGHPDYAPFSLPYCSRSTRVIVAAANDVLQAASKQGLLQGRIPKRFEYFQEIEKDLESDQHPRLKYIEGYFARQIPWLIQQNLVELAEHEKQPFSVLILSPTRVQVRDIVKGLRGKGMLQISHEERKESKGYSLADGLSLLLDDSKSNLGWRVAARSQLSDDEFSSVIRQSRDEPGSAFSKLLESEHRKHIKSLLKVLRSVAKGDGIDQDALTKVVKEVGVDFSTILQRTLQERFASKAKSRAASVTRRVSITATTIQGSKGLAADYVFLTHFDDTYLISAQNKSEVSDRDVCGLLVALTRARKKIILIPTKKEDPTFLRWIKEERIQRVSAGSDPQ